MRRVGWIVVGRGGKGEVWYPFLKTVAGSKSGAVRKWCADLGFEKKDRRRARVHWKHLRKVGRAEAVRIYIEDDGA